MKKLICLVAFLCTATANAAVINFGPTSAGGSGPLVTFDLITPTTVKGDALVTLSVQGDLDFSGEYIDVDFDGFSLGRIFDTDPSNDAFSFGLGGSNDIGTQFGAIQTSTATIAESIFASLISDGALNLSFQASSAVDFRGSITHIAGSISFDDSSTPVTEVSEPSSFALLGLGLVGLIISRRKIKA